LKRRTCRVVRSLAFLACVFPGTHVHEQECVGLVCVCCLEPFYQALRGCAFGVRWVQGTRLARPRSCDERRLLCVASRAGPLGLLFCFRP
jgi:hypothetical protein